MRKHPGAHPSASFPHLIRMRCWWTWKKNIATGFAPNSSVFFEIVRTHTIQGTFGDPYYGGNANFVGWDLIAYPGIRMAVGEAEQRMKVNPTAIRKSAYDDGMFTMTGGSHGH
jgi:gluconate 2-dehydrogenase gamma chain